MAGVKELKPGDPCPNCGGLFRAAPQATDAQRAAATPRLGSDTYVPLPPHYDTAAPAFIAEHGPLHTCVSCGYATRFAPAGAPAAPGAAA